jgi:hypothetical protein
MGADDETLNYNGVKRIIGFDISQPPPDRLSSIHRLDIA